jgi:hypothetical protein
MTQNPIAAAARPSEIDAATTATGVETTNSRSRYEATAQAMTSADLAHSAL